MRVLSIDSSRGTQVAVLAAGDQVAGETASGAQPAVLARGSQDGTRLHAESLGLLLASVLGEPRVADQPLDAVVVATGPAPFTGLRAGLVAARVVGRVRGVPVYGIPSLDAVARLALDRLGPGAGGEPVVLVATDARRKEVYAARYRPNGPDDVTRVDGPTVCPPREAAGLGRYDVVAGSGADIYPDLAEGSRVLAPVSGDCRTQVRLALSRVARGEPLPTEPLYLRHADVQVPAGRTSAR